MGSVSNLTESIQEIDNPKFSFQDDTERFITSLTSYNDHIRAYLKDIDRNLRIINDLNRSLSDDSFASSIRSLSGLGSPASIASANDSI